jgi:hypothetical protein
MKPLDKWSTYYYILVNSKMLMQLDIYLPPHNGKI